MCHMSLGLGNMGDNHVCHKSSLGFVTAHGDPHVGHVHMRACVEKNKKLNMHGVFISHRHVESMMLTKFLKHALLGMSFTDLKKCKDSDDLLSELRPRIAPAKHLQNKHETHRHTDL